MKSNTYIQQLVAGVPLTQAIDGADPADLAEVIQHIQGGTVGYWAVIREDMIQFADSGGWDLSEKCVEILGSRTRAARLAIELAFRGPALVQAEYDPDDILQGVVYYITNIIPAVVPGAREIETPLPWAKVLVGPALSWDYVAGFGPALSRAYNS